VELGEEGQRKSEVGEWEGFPHIHCDSRQEADQRMLARLHPMDRLQQGLGSSDTTAPTSSWKTSQLFATMPAVVVDVTLVPTKTCQPLAVPFNNNALSLFHSFTISVSRATFKSQPEVLLL
jgi:hypothetical protein